MSILVSGSHHVIVTSGMKFSCIQQSQDSYSSQNCLIPLPKEDPESKKQPQPEPTEPQRVLCGRFSECGRYLVLCDDYKQMTLWTVGDDGKVELRKQWNLERRVNSVIFGTNVEDILVADKSGDVYLFKQSDSESFKGKLILGHLSMLLDLSLSKCGNYILTCDRDEKIRVSQYPNAYNIHNYCLGHTDFVTSITCLDERTLLSSSGDGTLMVWNMLEGKEIFATTLVCPKDGDEDKNVAVKKAKVTKLGDGEFLIAVTLEGQLRVEIHLLHLNPTPVLKLVQRIELTSETWDICFHNNSSQFWIMTRSEPFLHIFRISQENGNKIYKKMSMDLGSHLQKDDTQFFEVAKTCNPNLDELYKRWFDNMKEYLEKKEERLNKENNKKQRTDEQEQC